MSRIDNQIQHRISEITELGMKKKEAQGIQRAIYEHEHGSLKGYELSKTPFIRSINTAKSYRKCGQWFAEWLYSKGINKINKVTPELAGQYLKEFDKNHSAWTTKQSLSAINKIFNYSLDSKKLGLKEREVKNIKRSRSGEDPNRPGLLIKYEEQIFLIKVCGCRRDSVTRITYQDIIFDENGIAIKVKLTEKGGKDREAQILKQYQQEFTGMIKKYENCNENIFKEFDNHVAAHYYRHLYATDLYNQLCEEMEPSGKFYKGYRKEVISKVSENLGHGAKRFSTVVNNYLY